MLRQFFLGVIQGVAEWLPVSSSGLLVLAQTRLFGQTDLSGMVKFSLFLHAGTFLAAVIYFRREIVDLFQLDKSPLRRFLVIATLVSGGLGFLFFQFLTNLESLTKLTAKLISVGIGILLVVTGALQIRTDGGGQRRVNDLNPLDALLFGLAQGLAVLPGFSRSGLTVAVLLFRKIEKYTALKVSFLGGLPIIFAGNILLNVDKFNWDNGYLIGMIIALIFGLLTIHTLLKLAKKVNFGYFVTAFGLITLIFSFI